jgi:DnaJ homolog subfamily B member 4
MDETYYNILNIETNATQTEIKKAYRRLSMQWHPDKNKTPDAEDKFKKISKAYEILSDDVKKSDYDRNHGIGSNMNIGGIDLNLLKNLFMQNKDLLNNFNFASNEQASGNPSDQDHQANFNSNPLFGFMQKPIPIIKTITVSMEDAYHGISYPLSIKRWIMTNKIKEYEEETIYVNIPEGIDDNEIIKFREKGNIINDKLKGDIKIFIKIEKEAPYLFKRKGLDLHYNKTITLKESLCGFSFQLNHINGESYQINNKDTIITPNYTKTVAKLGMKRDGRIGNLIINFTLIFPEQLSDDIKEKLGDILV